VRLTKLNICQFSSHVNIVQSHRTLNRPRTVTGKRDLVGLHGMKCTEITES